MLKDDVISNPLWWDQIEGWKMLPALMGFPVQSDIYYNCCLVQCLRYLLPFTYQSLMCSLNLKDRSLCRVILECKVCIFPTHAMLTDWADLGPVVGDGLVVDAPPFALPSLAVVQIVSQNGVFVLGLVPLQQDRRVCVPGGLDTLRNRGWCWGEGWGGMNMADEYGRWQIQQNIEMRDEQTIYMGEQMVEAAT